MNNNIKANIKIGTSSFFDKSIKFLTFPTINKNQLLIRVDVNGETIGDNVDLNSKHVLINVKESTDENLKIKQFIGSITNIEVLEVGGKDHWYENITFDLSRYEIN